MTFKKDESSADMTAGQEAVRPSKVARYASTRALSARLNMMKLVGVVNPLNPGGKPNGNDEPPALRSTTAESSSPTMNPYTESRVTNGASGAPMSRFKSTGAMFVRAPMNRPWVAVITPARVGLDCSVPIAGLFRSGTFKSWHAAASSAPRTRDRGGGLGHTPDPCSKVRLR